MPPVCRHIGTDREAVISFVNEAARHGYRVVYVANDIAQAFGAPTTMALPTIASGFLADGHALALPLYPLDLLPRVDRFDG